VGIIIGIIDGLSAVVCTVPGENKEIDHCNIIRSIMTTDFLYHFIRQHQYGVVATVSSDQVPESAVVGIAVTPDLKIIFDTVSDSRKYKNLLLNPHLAFVIGWDHEITLQYEGIAKMPTGMELAALKTVYFQAFPDGVERQSWKNIAYVVAEPKWIRYSDFNTQQIAEMRF
jgi:uncharacterized pyridoxamine 5'-phosphate oxidase family protein